MLGSPFDNGGGAYVHGWSATGTDVQDFAGGTPRRLEPGGRATGTLIVAGDLIVAGTSYAPTQLLPNWKCQRGSPAGVGQIVFGDLHGR